MTSAHDPQFLPRPSTARIAAWSGAFAVHLGVLGLLLLPIAQPLTPQRIERVLEALWIEPLPPLPMQPLPPIPQPPAVPVRRSPSLATPTPDTVVASALPTPDVAALQGPPDAAGPATPDPPAGGGAATDRGQLAYIEAPPPPYPREAMRKHQQGTVLLQVLVDAAGQPREVSLVRSSGYPLLDQAARTQVLKHWRFRPALRDGVPIPARGLVPVRFALIAG